jgi:outer membrane protein OmpA-like peptidoglycan-associated protein
MTHRCLRLAAILVLALGTNASVNAQDVSVDDIVLALTIPDTLSIAVEPVSKDLESKVASAAPEAVYAAIEQSDLPTIDIEINFAFNSSELTEASKSSLELLASAFADQRLREFRFVVGGHTDTRGTEAYNDQLSRQRADAAILFLILRGTDPARLVATGFGERFPKMADGEAAENRRVQIVTIK